MEHNLNPNQPIVCTFSHSSLATACHSVFHEADGAVTASTLLQQNLARGCRMQQTETGWNVVVVIRPEVLEFLLSSQLLSREKFFNVHRDFASSLPTPSGANLLLVRRKNSFHFDSIDELGVKLFGDKKPALLFNKGTYVLLFAALQHASGPGRDGSLVPRIQFSPTVANQVDYEYFHAGVLFDAGPAISAAKPQTVFQFCDPRTHAASFLDSKRSARFIETTMEQFASGDDEIYQFPFRVDAAGPLSLQSMHQRCQEIITQGRPYNLQVWNCEHTARYVLTGKAASVQVETLLQGLANCAGSCTLM